MEPDLNINVFQTQIDSTKSWVEGHSFLGWGLFTLLLIVIVIVGILNLIPSIDIFRSKILKPFVKNRKFKKLTKAAKKYDIRGYVNRAVKELQTELPLGWIRPMDIEWVEHESKEDFFHDDEVVIRVRPYEEQTQNFVNVTHQFLSKAFFPRVKKVIPSVQREAAILYFSGKIAKKRSDITHTVFIDHIFEPAVDREGKIVDYYERYSKLDSKGLFTGPFLREIQHVAEEVRTNSLRHQMGSELNNVLKHLEEFSNKYDESQKEEGAPIDEYLWSNSGAVSKYGLLLVASPIKVQGGIGQYVRRAQKCFDNGIERLYVIGVYDENLFANQVITGITNNTNYKLIERFELCRDYRGNLGGTGAVFVKNTN